VTCKADHNDLSDRINPFFVAEVPRIVKMEVDSVSESGNSREGESGDASPRITVEPAPDSPDASGRGPYERLMDILDLLELDSEKLRRDAEKLADKKDELMTTLDALRTSDHLLDLPEGKLRFRLRMTSLCYSLLGASPSFAYRSRQIILFQTQVHCALNTL